MRTPLFEEHQALKASIVDFAGWDMPVMYTTIIEEHNATRSAAGLFDICHMGEFRLRGADAESLLRRVLPTSLDKLSQGRAMYSCLCREDGTVIDDLFVYRFSGNEFILVVNASNIEKDLNWLRGQATGDVVIEDESVATGKIDLQGPRAADVLQQLFPAAVSLERFAFAEYNFDGMKILISRTGYTGEDGFELYVPASETVKLWRSLLQAGSSFGLLPCGLGARDSLRLEAAYSLYGHELTDETTPLEAGLGWLVSSNDEYIGHEVLRAQKTQGAPRSMICFECTGRGIPRAEYEVQKDGAVIGKVTSGVFSPTFNKGLGMALVTTGSAVLGDCVQIMVRGKAVDAEVVKRPIYAYKPRV